MIEKTVRVRVPGTSANCGPGFDAIGVACTIYDEIELTLRHASGLSIEVTGEGEESIPRDEQNIVWRSAQLLLQRAHMEATYPGAHIRMNNHIPLSRGLGSSAAAIVAGLKCANVSIGNHFNRNEMLQMAVELEGHPDNVAPAIFGGFAISIMHEGIAQCFSFLPKLDLTLVVAVPNFQLSTRDSRDVLPPEVPLKDAVFNIGRMGMMVAALCRGNVKFLQHVFEDRLHQPYRKNLIPGLDDAIIAAKRAGALGAALSGAGPCVVAYTKRNPEGIGQAMAAAFQENHVDAKCLFLGIDPRGVCLQKD